MRCWRPTLDFRSGSACRLRALSRRAVAPSWGFLCCGPTATKRTALATGAMFGGFAGAFFAARQGFISPESFPFQESALVLAIVVLGGMGSQLGVALAALTMIGGFELFRGLEQYRMLVFGVAMVLLMIWRPRGLFGHPAPTLFLQHRQRPSPPLL